jgi:serine/threonine protein phosphatase 1
MSRVPDGRRVYAVGDIHGRADLLRRLHRAIAEDAAQAGELHRVVVYLGDYVDRGPASSEVIENLLAPALPGFEAVHLKGNHEDMLLRFLDDPEQGELWLMNGGMETLESYGVEVPAWYRRGRAMETTAAWLRRAMGPRHLRFLSGLRIMHEEGDYLFVHAGVRPDVGLAEQREYDLMWIRDPFLRHPEPFGRIVVHGHTIAPEPEVRANRIGIDTGAYYYGRLTCLVLEGEERRFLQS